MPTVSYHNYDNFFASNYGELLAWMSLHNDKITFLDKKVDYWNEGSTNLFAEITDIKPPYYVPAPNSTFSIWYKDTAIEGKTYSDFSAIDDGGDFQCTFELTCESSEILDAFVFEVNQYNTPSRPPQPNTVEIFKSTNQGNYNRLQRFQHSPPLDYLSTEAHKAVDYIRSFMSKEELYAKRFIPHKTGILLHGPPGTGKSTLAKIIAKECNLNIYVIEPDHLVGHADSLLARVSFPAIVLVEDIDTAPVIDRQGKETQDAVYQKKVLHTYLNFFDGVVAHNGCVFMATTNYVDRLDPALVRKGRFNLHLEIGPLPQENIARMFEHFYELPMNSVKYLGQPKTIAEIQSILTDNMEDMASGAQELGIQFLHQSAFAMPVLK